MSSFVDRPVADAIARLRAQYENTPTEAVPSLSALSRIVTGVGAGAGPEQMFGPDTPDAAAVGDVIAGLGSWLARTLGPAPPGPVPAGYGRRGRDLRRAHACIALHRPGPDVLVRYRESRRARTVACDDALVLALATLWATPAGAGCEGLAQRADGGFDSSMAQVVLELWDALEVEVDRAVAAHGELLAARTVGEARALVPGCRWLDEHGLGQLEAQLDTVGGAALDAYRRRALVAYPVGPEELDAGKALRCWQRAVARAAGVPGRSWAVA